MDATTICALTMPWATREYRIDSVNRFGHVTDYSYRVTEPELFAVLGEWDAGRNINVMRRLSDELKARLA